VARGGEPDPFADLALADFKRDCLWERNPFHTTSDDVIADAFDDSEQPDYPVE